MRKIIFSFFAVALLTLNVYAKSAKTDFQSVIEDSGVDIESISVSVKNADNGKVVYSLNDKMLMNPASVQKILTTPASYEILGEDYKFKTTLYSRDENSYLIKLGADPYLKQEDLKTLVKNIKPEIQTLYLDDKVLDSKNWGEGWQWDDDLNILMPKFGSYNLDKNLIKLTVLPTEKGQYATIVNPSKFPLVFFNNIKTADKTSVDLRRDSAISANTLMLTGTVSRPTTIYVPVNNLQRYFNVQLSRTLEDRKLYLKNPFVVDLYKTSDVFVSEISHDIARAVSDIFKQSNNLVSETLFKLAGAKYMNLATGTDTAGIKMFNDYCQKHKLDNSRIRITDASGVSKNNLVSADFVTDFLMVNKDNKIMDLLPKPGEGTLTHRMLPIKESLRAKTGTLADVSSIAGYLTSKKGKRYVFCIITNDIKLSSSDKKMLEDFIIREAYLRL